ncbi:MAG TPA: pyridoxal phosphate-dependent aminotransferase [Steroidobacteraceae bacterium]|nr:pyridoxal phosphate-dependent aminotransferase [Steroidobacteraceae bacterium]
MPVEIAARVSRVKPSPTVALTGRVARLKAEGRDIVGLGVGEPDFDTPAHIAEAGIDAVRTGFTRYTAVEGVPELKDAIIAKFKRDNDIVYTRPQILVSTGAKQTIYNLFMALIDPGDEVVIPAPYWVSYPDMALLAEGVPVMPYAGPEQGYKITPEQLDRAITPRTRVFMLNSPSNPTGAAYNRAELEALGAVLAKHPRVIVATDDMYEHIYWATEPFCSFLTANPHLYERTVTINGVSKSYAMTGWRIGYCGGPVEIVTAMSTIQSQSTSNPVSISQRAATAAIAGDQSCVAEMNRHFKARHDFFNAGLNALPGFRVLPAAGTFYAWCDISEAMHALGHVDDHVFAEFLLEKAGVAGVPGSGFGAPGHIRFSFAVSMATLEKALERMGTALGAA